MRRKGFKKLTALSLAVAMVFTMNGMTTLSSAAKAKKKIAFNKTSLSLKVGQTKKLTIKNKPAKAKLKWSTSNKKVATVKKGKVKAVKKGERASPGELKGDFDLTRDSGTLYANTECGIFGKLSAEDAAKITGAALPIAKKDEVKTGRAAILATVSGNETREYDIEIEKIYSPSGSTRNLLLRVTDEELLAQTGGVVQGMSGSAILQDGKIIGAVTHVLLDDPSRGYGIFIENMLSAAGLSSE